MRVLVVDEEIPFPLNSGKRLRTFNLLKHLAKKHEIYFICRRHEDILSDDAGEMKKAGIKAFVVPHNIRKKNGLRFNFALFVNIFSATDLNRDNFDVVFRKINWTSDTIY